MHSTDDLVGTATSVAIFVAMIIVSICIVMLGVDHAVASYAQSKTVDFVDQIRTDGKIDPDAYIRYTTDLERFNSYKAEMTITENRYYAETDKDKDDTSATFLGYNHQDILDYMFKQKDSAGNTVKLPFVMNKGDFIKVKVTRTGPGLTSLMQLVNLQGHPGDFVCEYSGLIEHDGSIR